MSPLKLSWIPLVCYEALVVTRTMQLTDLFDLGKELKLDAVEVQHHYLQSYDEAYLLGVRRELDKRSLAVCQITGSGDFVHPDPAVRESETERLKQQIRAAQILGARSIRITAGQQHEGFGIEEAIGNFRGCMTECFDLAGRAGVALAYENHYKDIAWPKPDFSFRAADFLRFFRAMEDTPLRVNYDAANQVMANEDPLEVLEVVKSRVVHMHANDRATPGQYRHSVVGEGIVPLAEIFRRLRDAGFAGYVSLEYNGDQGLEGVRRSLAAIRKFWRENN